MIAKVTSMKSIGNVVSISDGKLVVKTKEVLKRKDPLVLKPGTKVFDESGNFVGIVHEYFGPTDKPYVLISPKKKPDQYLGRELFA